MYLKSPVFIVLTVAVIFTESSNKYNVKTGSPKLAALRELMNSHQGQLQAFLVTSDDEHQTEFVSDYDRRLLYISGFSGSSGYAVVTLENAALWTDGRYHIQAQEELDDNWLLMKAGTDGVPSKEEWLSSQFPNGASIGADPKLVSASVWNSLESKLKDLNENFTLVQTETNLIDAIWKGHDDIENIKEGFTMDLSYTGKEWIEKVNETKQELETLGADAMVVTALDEVAWLLNIRGYDIPYSYLLKGYVIITENETVLYVDPRRSAGNISASFEGALRNGNLRLKNYLDVWTDLPKYSQICKKVLVPSAYTYSPGANKKIYDAVPAEKRMYIPSPIIDIKAKKNPTEILGMRMAHVRDSAALCRFIQHFESQFSTDEEMWDEWRVTQLVDKYRFNQDLLLNVSFPTIVGFAEHGALPHYQATPTSSIVIFSNSTIVIDSGGQYYDGTTDVTRTLHMGTPTHEQKQAYTRVLMGCIQLSSLIFPNDLSTSGMDTLARMSLWEIGHTFLHGTGHGVGASLVVHESPISVSYKSSANVLLKPGYFLSNEPGFYLEGGFGVRLENVMEVVAAPHLKTHRSNSFFAFKDATLVPYEMKLIDFGLLNINHVRWLNNYNGRIRNIVGPELIRQNALEAFDWMMEKTKRIPEHSFLTVDQVPLD